MSLLRAEKLVKQYNHRKVVDGVSIHVEAGEVVGLLGPNGAGKITTFNMVVGLVKPDAGAVLFHDQPVTSKAMHQRARLGMGYLTQEPSVFRLLELDAGYSESRWAPAFAGATRGSYFSVIPKIRSALRCAILLPTSRGNSASQRW